MWYFKNGSHSKPLNLDGTQNNSGSTGLVLFDLIHKKNSPVITKNVTTHENEEKNITGHLSFHGSPQTLLVCWFSFDIQHVNLLVCSELAVEKMTTIIVCPAVIQTEFTPNLAQRLKRKCFPVHFGQEPPHCPAAAVADVAADGLAPQLGWSFD